MKGIPLSIREMPLDAVLWTGLSVHKKILENKTRRQTTADGNTIFESYQIKQKKQAS
jgi:hypothetical protein